MSTLTEQHQSTAKAKASPDASTEMGPNISVALYRKKMAQRIARAREAVEKKAALPKTDPAKYQIGAKELIKHGATTEEDVARSPIRNGQEQTGDNGAKGGRGDKGYAPHGGGGGITGMSGERGPAPGSTGWSMMAGEQRRMHSSSTEEDSKSGVGGRFGKDFEVTPNVVTGRWADTLQGQRVNDAAGSGIHDGRDFKGDGSGNYSDDRGKTGGAIGAVTVGAAGAWGGFKAGAALGAGLGPYGAIAGAAVGAGVGYFVGMGVEHAAVEVNEVLLEWLDPKTKRPREDDSGGDYVPITVGHGRGAPIGNSGQGRAGGSGDGRGDPADVNGGPERQTGKAIAQHAGGGADKPEKAVADTKVSLETMLRQSFFTDPQRS